MLFRKEFKTGIRAGRITRTYRTWKKPQARLGGQYNLAPGGVICVTALSTVSPGAIADEPGRRAGDLAPGFGWDTPTFKRQIRKLKGLGLTESLETGYTLSPRGAQLLAAQT